ncbi:hypothetical protein HBI56_096700 [Parastagonospora nodorum]|nr:hypothetical protein HBH53_216820 [Parastagonospora nodorum]KAH3998151.1 hypothetical protein HBI10_129470 [Parastagonospora nodorum]KAH4030201.1 hypothetical protein HBI13_038110 [Parastagonospora nodorum]KAH4076619.1 hypothetical protein HBH50_008030 [Parastagonospora nodorum]KAH4095901.1 hypothetical protein HBH48_049770 [Parastagonospora nodorum]
MDIEQRNRDQYTKDLSILSANFSSSQTTCTVFDVNVYKNNAETPLIKCTEFKHPTDLEDWISTDPHKAASDIFDSRLRIIVGARANDDPTTGLFTIPFSRPTFELIMEGFRFPKTILRAIYKGEAMFSGILENREENNAGWNGSVMRMVFDIHGNEGLAIATSWNLKAGITYALILGCNDKDLNSIVNFITYSTRSVSNPLLLLTMFAGLQLKRFKDLHRTAYGKVQLDIYRAQLDRQDGPEVIAVRRTARTRPTDYDDATREVLRHFQDTGTLGQAMLQFRAEVVKVGQAVKSITKTQRPAPHSTHLKSSGKQITGQLVHILGRLDIYIERNRLTINEASLVMSAFWNLIAQRDNKTNQKIAMQSKNIAEQSRNVTDESKQIAQQSLKIANQTQNLAKTSILIAKQTKRDSSAVKAISLLTMVFLPATYSAFYWYGPSGFGGQIIG